MKYTELKQMLAKTTHSDSVVLYGHHPHSDVYTTMTEWLEKIGYQVNHWSSGYEVKPWDVVVALDADCPAPCAGTVFDLFELNTGSDSSEIFSYKLTGAIPDNHRWYRSSEWNGDCEFESDAYEFMPDLMPELAEIFSPEQAEMIYMGANQACPAVTYPFVRLCDRILQAHQAGKRIFLMNTEENIQDPSFWKSQRAAEYLAEQVSGDRIFYVSGGIDASDAIKHYTFTNPIEMLSVVRFDWISTNASESIETVPEYKVEPKPRDYINFNRSLRPHRQELLDGLIKMGLTDNSFTSFDLDGTQPDAETYPALASVADTMPWVLNRNADRDNPVYVTDDDFKYYQNSYFSVITETVFYQNDAGWGPGSSNFQSRFLSEKPFKSIVAKHPFMVVGQVGIMQALRDMGYKTFSPWIDESYDLIEDDTLRMRAIQVEIRRLCRQTESEWLTWQENIQDIVEYNYKYNQTTRSLAVKNSAYHKLLKGLDNGS